MTEGARTPEELESMLEDAFVVGDRDGLSALFDAGGVLAGGDGGEARGGRAIRQAATGMWRGGRTYVGGPSRVLQARDTGLVVSPSAIHVVRQGDDRAWRFAISLLGVTTRPPKEET